jgi:hypothetical protein
MDDAKIDVAITSIGSPGEIALFLGRSSHCSPDFDRRRFNQEETQHGTYRSRCGHHEHGR